MSLMSLKNAHKQGVCDISDINFDEKIFSNFFLIYLSNKQVTPVIGIFTKILLF